jgi:hypothetical protein
MEYGIRKNSNKVDIGRPCLGPRNIMLLENIP